MVAARAELHDKHVEATDKQMLMLIKANHAKKKVVVLYRLAGRRLPDRLSSTVPKLKPVQRYAAQYESKCEEFRRWKVRLMWRKLLEGAFAALSSQ